MDDIGVESGQMGDNLPDIDLGQGRIALALAVGWFHTCVILDDGTVRCFGRNYDGQLGLGDTEDRGNEVWYSTVQYNVVSGTSGGTVV